MAPRRKMSRSKVEKVKPFGPMAKDMRENVAPIVGKLDGGMRQFGNSRFAKTIGFEYPAKKKR